MSQQVKVTARDLIRRALVLVGVLGQGENLPDSDAIDALATLNEIVDKWNVESLMIPSEKTISFNLTGKKSYTFGPGGDIDALRPPSGVFSAYYNMPQQGNNPISFPMSVITDREYEAITLKELKQGIPDRIVYTGTFPFAEVMVYPIASSGQVFLRVSDQFLTFDSLDEIIDLPSGYIKALRYNLAVELSPEYGRPIDEQIVNIAIGAKRDISTTNGSQKQQVMFVDSALLGCRGFNIFSG